MNDFGNAILKKYCAVKANGERETSKDVFCRVARSISSVDGKYESEYESMMSDLLFLPNSPTLANAGRSNRLQLSACYVLPVEDDMDAIYDCLKWQALIHKSGGGTGFNFSKLRPEGSLVSSSGGQASGPVSFMRLFNASTQTINQGGFRRGANMACMNADHPDIRKFIHAKENPGHGLDCFNLSVLFDEKSIRGDLIKECAEVAWKSGEPGVLFKDTINRNNRTPWLGELEATNPCGETPLYPFEACNLGSVNLVKFVREDGSFNDTLFERTVRLAVRFLDNVISVNNYPLDRIAEAVRRTRKIGLGVFGFADLLFKLRVPYNSEEAVKIADSIAFKLNAIADDESRKLGVEKGFYENGDRRNATVTCIAPTGTLSLIASASSGIEPVFALSQDRIVNGERKTMLNNFYLNSVDHLSLPELKRIFVTADKVQPEYHLRIQSAFQRHTDLAVSKTVNLAHTASVKDIHDVYMKAYELGCKGVTVFRDGCLSEQVLYKNPTCPVCGLPLVKSEGCTKCSACDFGLCAA